MPQATGTSTAKYITWSSDDTSVRYFDVYRRADSVTADLTTADVVAKVGFGTNHFIDVRPNTEEWYWIKAVSWAGHSSGYSDTITAVSSVTIDNSPNGFPNTTDSVHSFTDGTRTYSISPTATFFNYYVEGVKYTITAAQTVQVANSSGLTLIAFDSAGITSQKDPTQGNWSTYIRDKALCAAVYYSTAAGTHTLFGEERHGITMSTHTHANLHFTRGCQYISGLALDDVSADGTGDLDTNAQFGVASGVIADEDINNPISAIAYTVGLSIWYRDTDTFWRKTTNAGFSILAGGVSGRMEYNPADVWGLADVDSNRYALCHVFGTNDYNKEMVAIVGQYQYNSIADARLGASVEMGSLLLGDLPTAEFVPVASLIYQTNDGYLNAVKSRVRTTDLGDNYVDWRTSEISRGAGAGNHGSLGGLSNDDHSQYLLLAGRTGQVIDDSLTISGAVTINNDLAISSQLTAGVVQLDTAYVHPAHSEGALHWNADDGTLDVDMPGGNVHLQVGQEMYIRAKNDQSAAISNGQVVYICSATGSRPSVALADATNFAKTNALAMATEDIADGNNGYFTTMGLVRDLNTNGMGVGTPIYLDPSTPGGWTTTYTPATAGYTVALGYIIRDHLTEGAVLFKSQLVPRVIGLSDVEHCAATTGGQFLRYDSTEGIYRHYNHSMWETAAGSMTISANVSVSGTITVDGVAKFNSTMQVTGTLTCGAYVANGGSQVNGTLEVNDEAWFTGDVTIGTIYTKSYIEFTAQASYPTQPASGGMVRMFAIDSAGTTRLCIIDTAGAITQMGAGAGGASVALDNLDTVAINTSLVSDTNGTDDLGTTSVRWNNLYAYSMYIGTGSSTSYFNSPTNEYVGFTGGGVGAGGLIPLVDNNECLGVAGQSWREFHCQSAFVTNLSVAGSATISLNLQVNGSLIVSSAFVSSDLFIFTGTGSFTSPVAFNSNVNVSGALTCDGAVRLQSTLDVSGNTTITGDLDVSGNGVVSGYLTVGTYAQDTSYGLQVQHDRASAAASYAGYIWQNPTPTAVSANRRVGIAGYTMVGNTNVRGENVGLSFGPYGSSTVAGDTATTTLVGIETWGMRGFNTQLECVSAIGLRVWGVKEDGASDYHATDVFGILIESSSDDGAGYIRNHHQLHIRSNNGIGVSRSRQVVLEGTSTASDGIWFGGSSGFHIGHDGTDLYLASMRNASNTYYLRYNNSTNAVTYTTSNRDSKKNIRDWTPDHDKIYDLRPRKFEYKDDVVEEIGYIAEEVEDVGLSELCDYQDGKPMNVRYDKVCMYLIEKVKKLEEKIDGLERRQGK